MVFVCHRTVSVATVYQLKVKYDQDKFGVFLDTKRPVNFPLEDNHVVNGHHVVLKSHNATQKNVLTWCILLYHVIGLKQTWRIKRSL